MSTPVSTGWIKDSNGEKFAPKTLTSQVQTSDGILLEDKLQTDLNILRIEVKKYTDDQIATIPAPDLSGKVNVTDIINNLTTDVANKPLSAAQGVKLKELVDELGTQKLDSSALSNAITTALAEAKASGEFDGTSISHEWNGTTLTITSANGTSSANLQGPKGESGATMFTYGTADLSPGESELATGTLYFVYE